MSGEHYFSTDPSAPTQRREVSFGMDGRQWRMASAGGVFSADRLDPGTAVLLRETPSPPDARTYLDLGCGFGPIACVLATRAPRATVWAVDVNERALELTRANAAALGVAERVRVTRPEAVPADAVFDGIWSNPPIRVGKAVLHDLLLTWLPRLTPAGSAWLVVSRHLGSDPLQRWLQEQGYACERHASRKGYRILRVRPG